MAIILNIDTATETGSFCISEDAEPLYFASQEKQKDHAAWLHRAIENGINELNLSMKNLDAVGITSGPGSYTGLRVAMAAAKGICYALNIPMITENTLKVMAKRAIDQFINQSEFSFAWYCPMIDARRDEVFTALYNENLEEIVPTEAMILQRDSFHGWLSQGKILFFGSGSEKWKAMNQQANASYADIIPDAATLGSFTFNKYKNKEFTELSYSEPAYTKEFFTHTRN